MLSTLIAGTAFSLIYGLLIVLQQKFVRGMIHPLHLSFLSYFVSLGIITISLQFKNKKTFKFKSSKGVVIGIIAALLVSVIADLLVLYGLQRSSSINWGILSRLTVIVTYLVAVLFLGEKSSSKKLIAIAISMFGAFLVVLNFNETFALKKGDILFIGAVLALGIGNTCSQLALRYISIAQLAYVRIVSAALVLSIITLLFFPLEAISVWPFIVFNAFIIVISIFLINFVIKKAGAVFFVMIASQIPLFAVVFSVILLQEIPSIYQVLGGVLVVYGVFIFHREVLVNRRKS